MPQLKSFLKDYEAEEYRNVSVEYVPGRKAIMTIYDDGEEKEQIVLSDYETKEEMHALFVEKGFVKMSAEEIKEMKEVNQVKEEEARKKRDEERAKRRHQSRERKEKERQEKEKRKKLEEEAKANEEEETAEDKTEL